MVISKKTIRRPNTASITILGIMLIPSTIHPSSGSLFCAERDRFWDDVVKVVIVIVDPVVSVIVTVMVVLVFVIVELTEVDDEVSDVELVVDEVKEVELMVKVVEETVNEDVEDELVVVGVSVVDDSVDVVLEDVVLDENPGINMRRTSHVKSSIVSTTTAKGASPKVFASFRTATRSSSSSGSRTIP